MLKVETPNSLAFNIHRLLFHLFGADAYPVDVRGVVREFAPRYAPDVELNVAFETLTSVEGALLPGDDARSFTILVNEAIKDDSRKEFTLAHEFGHFLMHRRKQLSFMCGAAQIDDIGRATLEAEANEFASRLLLPPSLVRPVADGAKFEIGALRELAAMSGASLLASALACVQLSSRPIAMAKVTDGRVCWGRASDSARKQGLYFCKEDSVPEDSIVSFEDGLANETFKLGQRVSGWRGGATWLESGYYSSRLNYTLLLLTK